VAKNNEDAIRDLLRPLLGDAPNVFVGEPNENIFPVTITLDSAAASHVGDVQDLIKDPSFATDLSIKLDQPLSIGYLQTSVNAVGAPTPPPPSPPPSSLRQPVIAILSGGVIVLAVLSVCLLHKFYEYHRRSGSSL